MNDPLDSMQKEELVAYLEIGCTIVTFEEIEETTKNQGKYSNFMERVSNKRPSDYEEGLLTTR